MSFSLCSLECSISSSGISTISNSAPNFSSFHTIAFLRTRSTTPFKLLSIPIGSCITKGKEPSLSLIISTVIKKLAPVLSNLLIKHILGTLYLSACLQTVSVCGSTPATPSKTAIAPSNTLSDLSTSMVKSTCPGVSIILIL